MPVPLAEIFHLSPCFCNQIKLVVVVVVVVVVIGQSLTPTVEATHTKSDTLFFYKNIFYKNREAEICEILRLF